MMARNLKVFIKIYSEIKRKGRKEIENLGEDAVFLDHRMTELEKLNVENRILVLGACKPNLFFNTHPKVYEKCKIHIKNAKSIRKKTYLNIVY